jgi:hypothetical protein
MRVKQKEPWRPPKKYKKIEKKRKRKIKREKGAHYYSLYEIHTRTPSYIFVLHRDHHACI